MITFVVFPTALYNEPFVPESLQVDKFMLLEEPSLIYDPKWRPIRVNKNKIAFFRATMKAYVTTLKKHRPGIKVEYIDYKKALALPKSHFNGMHAWDICDHVVRRKYEGILTFHSNAPGFVLSEDDMDVLKKRGVTRLVGVYNHLKAELGVLKGVPSQDSENRKPLPAKGLNVPNVPRYKHNVMKEAIAYAMAFGNGHVGDPTLLEWSPVTHEQAREHLAYFVKHRLAQFGPYQDAVAREHIHMFHSNISHLLNVGLLTPREVLNEVMKQKRGVPITSLEGFVRQLIGWREFMRYIYERFTKEIMAPFEEGRPGKTPIPSTSWRSGVEALDTEIEKAQRSGYAHHIVRLMYFLNFMKLMGVHPRHIYVWFMEVVSIDAYDWVMYSNIGSMGFFTQATVAAFMGKPYISTSAYIQKMSNYKERNDLWDALFYHWILRNEKKLEGGAKVYLRNLATFQKFSKDKQQAMLKLAEEYVV